MAIKNEIRKEREKLKNATSRQKLEFFWDYYKWHTLSLMIVLTIIASFVYSAVTSKDVVLSGIFLNCYQSSFETHFDVLAEELLRKQNVNPEKCMVEINEGMIFDPDNEDAAEINYQSIQRIGAQVTVGELDFMIGNLAAMMDFAESGTFYDLSEVLGQDELETLKSYIIYNEQAEPVLLDVSSCEKLMENYPYLQEPLVLGIAVNAPHQEMVLAWIELLLNV